MKRILASVMVLSVLSIGFVGCGDAKKPAAPAKPAAEPAKPAGEPAAPAK